MSKRKKVLLPQPVAPEAVELLHGSGVEVVEAVDPDPATVSPLLKNAQAVLLRTGIHLTRELIDEADELMIISRTGGGVDNVDIRAATQAGVIVTSSVGVNTASVIEHALALMLSLNKQLFRMDREVRSGNFKIRYQNLPRDLQGKCLGVIGFGRIGTGLAKACKQVFGMKIIANDDFLPERVKEDYRQWVEFVTLDELFAGADVVSVHIPFTEKTTGLIDRRYLDLMKPDGWLINTSRGGVIHEQDLIRALQDGKLAGAGLDVFEREPLDRESPLLQLSNVIVTPHSAALTKECVIRMATSGAERILQLFAGLIPDKIANPEVLKNKRWQQLKEQGS